METSTISKTPCLITGLIIGGLLALLEAYHIHAHLPFLWVGIFGILFLLGINDQKNKVTFTLATLVASFFISVPYISLIDKPLYYFSPFILVCFNAILITAFYLYFLQSCFIKNEKSLLNNVLSSFSTVLITAIFTGICWVILILSGMLFAQAKILLLNQLVAHNAFIWFVLSVFASLGFYINYKNAVLRQGIIHFIYFVSRYLFIPLSVVAIIFVILAIVTRTLDFHGNYYLFIAFLSAVFINGSYSDNHYSPFKNTMQIITKIFLLITPIFSILALISAIKTGKGTTPEAFQSYLTYLASVSILLLFNLTYAGIACTNTKNWRILLAKTNRILAWILIVTTLLTINPLLLHLSF